ncbi:NAD(P)H-dependent oxidoreductase [Sphingomonas carotinifaciens]|uniref:Flavodoxin family protein n=1 Tax=Sphingomonas carotinifaciens TaxID=1166323 RepID=A0A1G7S2V6_9SPHN|nr:NAD(P)H-dependent oxidoreductase [Sphingomonas carotinifaciens]MBB4088159.1 NAD(P)H dehydrogenase (quinone) [Sphingomonas carotinifaciens]MWC45040.1 flavodoxin family protein [Sphingomonas carotinifaciens]SDG17304.1 NAD(P)H dehydrogenase (quinone) [Sphingomonas carotinifaciens]
MHILLVMAHPAGPSLTCSVASAILDAGTALGHSVELVDLVAEGFDPVFGPADHAAFTAAGPTPPDVRREQQRIDRADHLVLVHPVYWWSMPAVLKGWIDRVFVSGWAFEENADGRIVKKLGRLNVHLIALAGASAATYAKHGYRDAMRAQIDHGIFDFCGAPVVTSELIDGQMEDLASVPSKVASLIDRHLA